VRFAAEVPELAGQLRKLIESRRTDLVYINGPRLVPAAVLAAGRRFPVVFHCHSHVPAPYGSLLVREPLNWAGALVISSSISAAASIGLQPGSPRLQVVCNGVADCAHPRAANTDRLCTIGMIGRVVPQKGQHVFVQAARILKGASNSLRFEIAGAASDEGYYERVRSMADGLPVALTGWTDNVASTLARIDVLVVPSVVAESSPRVILEAFSAGVPVVAFASGGVAELIDDGRTGILVQKETPEALASAIRELLSRDNSELDALRRAARQDWETRFTLRRYQRDIADSVATFKAAQKQTK
jgi:glycosyltransferase involved in cell wall biosynthesis